MMKKLELSDVSCVSSFWSFFPDEQHSALGLFLYELIRDSFLWVQHFKRPELCVRGIRRGEDGSLALSLKPYGKIAFLYNRKARPITGYGTLNEGNLWNSLWNRVRFQMKGISRIFYKTDHYEDTEENMMPRK